MSVRQMANTVSIAAGPRRDEPQKFVEDALLYLPLPKGPKGD